MAGGFVTLNTALSALYAQQHGLDVTGQNVANANTDGYTRQRIRTSAIGSPSGVAIHSTSFSAGQGVRTVGFDRLQDAFLERRALQEQSTLSGLTTTRDVLDRIERSFNEPGENGIQAQLSKLWGAWSDVANRPTDPGARTQLGEVAATLAGDFNRLASDFGALRDSLTQQLGARVADVNATAVAVAELNARIQTSVNAGGSPNDLLDERDRLVGHIAELADVTIRSGPAGTVDILVGGTAVVRGAAASSMNLTASASGAVSLSWNGYGTPVDVTGGEVGSLAAGVNTVVPGYLAQLDVVANQLRTAVNAQHALGADGMTPPTSPPVDFFSGTGAGDLAVNPLILSDPRLIAAGASGAGALDGANAQAIARLSEQLSGPDAAYRNMVTTLGIDAQRASRRVDTQTDISRQVDEARKSQASVSLDEEMTNMLMYQHAYEAAARLMTTVDETMDVLMRTGVVGR
jgi:flagellar hook-associated protein 1 FlgK